MFKKLRNKFLFSNMILTTIVLLATFAVLFSLVFWNERQETENRVVALPSSFVQNDATPVPAAGSVVRYVVDITAGGEHIGIATCFKIAVTADGQISDSNPNYELIEEPYIELAKTAWSDQNIHRVLSLGETYWEAIIVPSDTVSGEYDIFFMDVTSSKMLLNDMLYTFLAIVPLTLLAVFLISRRIAVKSVQPISEAWQKQRQFITDASHELKTPLAIITANADALMLDTETNKEGREKWVGYIKDETDRMAKLVNALLYLAKVEDGSIQQEAYAEFDLGQCVSDYCIVVEAMIYEKNITLEYDIEDGVIVHSSEELIKKLISTLLDNAIKYTDGDGYIRVRLKKHKTIAELSIENSGTGIPADKLPFIFDRFYRADPARTNEDGSYGLGLAIAQSIANQLRTSLTAKSIPNQSTTFTLQIKTSN